MTEPLFQRTGGADFPDKLKVLVSGPPKSGKTSLLGTVPNIVIADTEPHANNLQSVAHKNIPFVTVNHSGDLQRLRFVLGDASMRAKAAEQMGMPAIEAVAIDTMDTLQKLMKKERMAETRQSKFLRDDWGWIKEEMVEIVNSFTALPLHVFFIVHTKTKEIGSEENSKTVVLPGLEGSIDEIIAGMVGYSLLSFRTPEVRPDGSPYTKYWLRAEGDGTHEFLGTRTAGRLPDVIEPDFNIILAAAQAGRQAALAAGQGGVQVQAPVQTATPPPAQPAQAQNSANSAPAPTGAAPQAAQPVAQNSGQPAPPEDNGEPVNAAALQHVSKVYEALGVTFPEDLIKGLTMGDARQLVTTWKAIQHDHHNGKGAAGTTPVEEMTAFLGSMEWLAPTEQQQAEEQATPAPATESAPVQQAEAVVPDLNGGIPQVLAYVGQNREKIQEAYDSEVANKNRKTLLAELVNRGAKPTEPTPEPTPDPGPPVQTDVETSAPSPAETPVTQESAPAEEVPTEQQAVETVQEGLGATVLGEEPNPNAPCEECGVSPVDDEDIATLSKQRFGRWLCVADYIAETKKPRVNA